MTLRVRVEGQGSRVRVRVKVRVRVRVRAVFDSKLGDELVVESLQLGQAPEGRGWGWG